MELGCTFAGEFYPSDGETGLAGGIMAGWGGGVGHRGFPAVQTDVTSRLHVFAQLLWVGFIGTGEGRRVKSSLHFVPLIKVQAAFKLPVGIIISV